MYGLKVVIRLALVGALLLGLTTVFAGVALAEVAAYVGTETCLECHDEMSADFSASLHSKAWESSGDYRENSCEACHGPGSLHVDDPSKETIMTFGEDSMQSADQQSDTCLGCHSASQEIALWDMGMHAKRGVSCSSCHSIHKGYSPLAAMPETCYSCHLDVKIEANKASRHPIKEGEVGCNDCHNPHGTLSDAQIRDESTNQLCYQCHADKRGPFLWEHAPVEQDCSNCHTPHGSRHKKLLTQRVPNLCQSCHERHGVYDKDTTFAGSSPSRFSYGRSCVNCHQNIHGSWAPNRRGAKFFK